MRLRKPIVLGQLRSQILILETIKFVSQICAHYDGNKLILGPLMKSQLPKHNEGRILHYGYCVRWLLMAIVIHYFGVIVFPKKVGL